jgi:TolB-like protein/Flp pilus assembly protein TadD
VLPFANLGNDSSNTPMVLGVHAELITQLTKLANLQVTSRSSALEYQDSRKTEKEIAHELGVTALVTGSIQRSGDQIRFTIALSDAEKGTQLWAESYDRDYTAENLFAIQADIARSVADALSLRLSPGQDTANARPPTRNLAALNLYYRSLADWDNRQNLLDDSSAVRLRAAVALDTAFGAAWGLLAQMESWYLRAGQASDTLPASQALRRVQSLLPGSLEATLAAGYYDYYAKGDFQGALTAMDQAARQQPGSTDISQVRALLLRRLGRWDEAVTLLEQVHRLEPRKVIVMIDLGTCYQVLRRWDQALTTFGQVLAQSPGDPSALNGQQLTLVLKGDTAAAAHVGDSSAVVEPQVRAIIESQTALVRRDYAAAASVLQAWPTTSFTAGYGNRLSQAALLNWLGGDSARMRLAVDSLLATNVAARAKRTRPGPGDPFGARSTVMMTSALGYALRHERTRAIALVDSALALYPPAGDAIDGVIALRMVAIVYLVAGDPDRAVAALHTLLSYPSAMSSAYLRLDPTWDRLRSHPGFQQLLTESHEPHSS